MGFAFLDLIYRLERRFGTKISPGRVHELFEENHPPDITAGALFDLVRSQAEDAGVVDADMDAETIWHLFQHDVAAALGCEPDEVTKGTWLRQELGAG